MSAIAGQELNLIAGTPDNEVASVRPDKASVERPRRGFTGSSGLRFL